MQRMNFHDPASLSHRTAAWIALWLFALGVSVTLVSGWGRSVASDQQTITTAAQQAVSSDVVADRLTEWLGTALAQSELVPATDALDVARTMWADPRAREPIDAIVAELASAAVAPGDEAVELDVSDEIRALLPAVADAMTGSGLPTDTIEDALVRVAPVQLAATAETAREATSAGTARSIMSVALLVGLFVVISAGGSALILSTDRIATTRTLAARVATAALTFTIMLRLSAWALDPSGGASDLRGSGATLLGSNLHIPLIAAAVALLIVSAISVFMRRRVPLDPPAPTVDRAPGAAKELVGSARR